MADGLTITAANAVYALSVVGLFDVPQVLQGYTADAAFDTEAAEPAETVMGVDGHMSAGYTPYVTRQTISIMPDSPSSVIFENWLAAQKSARDVFFANATISMRSVGRKYTLTRGVLSSIMAIPGARKVLQGRPFIITWQDISPAAF
jgi:hypothetical protein